jgi:DNA-binding transcriptional LysR family regulator
MLAAYLDRERIRPISTIDVSSVSLLVSYVSGGLGIGLAPALALTEVARSRLDVEVAADGLDDAELARAAELSGRTCPVSNSYAAAGVELDDRVSLAAAA